MRWKNSIITTGLILGALPGLALADTNAQRQAAQRVSDMVSDRQARSLASEHDLDIVNVMWEDTGRWQGSSLGPNISDVTIEVETKTADGGTGRQLMPVLRYPNFSDKTADVDLDDFYVRVGNERGADLEPVSLRDLLDNPQGFLNLPDGGEIEGGSLLAERDTHALVSAQHAFLPIRAGADTKFWPVMFNYQSRREHPAVLSILATRQGTSATVIDNSRDTVSGSHGQRLYFNDDGERAPLLAERLSDVKERGTTANDEDAESLGEDANVLLLIQVPLKFERPQRHPGPASGGAAVDMEAAPAAPQAQRRSARDSSDVETAVLGHGDTEGPYTELDGLTIERDPRFPVRVTAQFYQATSNGIVSADDIASMSAEIDEVYDRGDYVGSLVVPDPSDLERPTNWDGVTTQPPGTTWRDFPGVVQLLEDWGFQPRHWQRPGERQPSTPDPSGSQPSTPETGESQPADQEASEPARRGGIFWGSSPE